MKLDEHSGYAIGSLSAFADGTMAPEERRVLIFDRSAPLPERRPPRAEEKLPEHETSAPPSLNVGGAVSPFAVPDRRVDDFQVQLRRSERQIEIAKRIEMSEVVAAFSDACVGAVPAENLIGRDE